MILVAFSFIGTVFPHSVEASEVEEPGSFAASTMAAQSGLGFVAGSATSVAGAGLLVGAGVVNESEAAIAGGIVAIGGPLITVPLTVNLTGRLMEGEFRHLGAHLGALASGIPTAAGLYLLATRTDFENPLALIGLYNLATSLGSVVGYHLQASRVSDASIGESSKAMQIPLMQWQMQF